MKEKTEREEKKKKRQVKSLLKGNNIGLSYHQKLFYECRHLDREVFNKRKEKEH